MKKIYLLLLLIAPVLLQGCFEVVEQVQLNNNGSGNFQLTLNMSQSKTKLNSMMKLRSVNGHPVPTKYDVNNELAKIAATLEKTKGISAVKTSIDFENFIGVISFNFTNVAALNLAVKNVAIKENAKDYPDDNYSYDAASKTFTRKNKFQLNELYKTMSNADKEIFTSATYTSIYKFESTVNTVSNKDAKLSASKKAVMLRENALDIITQKKSLENKININK